MADSRRVNKASDSLKRVISEILDTKVKDPGKGFVTITKVKVSPDLKIASVYYTVLGDEEQKEKTRTALRRSAPFIKKELKPHLRMRWLPELRFFYDETLDEADKIERLLKEIKDGNGTPEE